MPIGIPLFGPFLIPFALILILYVLNRKNRNEVINGEKLNLIQEGNIHVKKILNLKRIIPVAIFVVLTIISVINYVGSKKPEIDNSSTLTSVYPQVENNVFDIIFKPLSWSTLVYLIMYLILMNNIKNNKEMNEETKNAMKEYYGGRTIYLVVLCITLFALTTVLGVVLVPTGGTSTVI